MDWASFQKLDISVREAIVDALLSERERGPAAMIRYFPESLASYLSERAQRFQMELVDSSDTGDGGKDLVTGVRNVIFHRVDPNLGQSIESVVGTEDA
jgi:hypothetical protein